MSVINVQTSDTFEQWRVKSNEVSTLVGDGALLETTAVDVVSAINELRNGSIDGTLTTNGNTFRVQVDSGDTYELELDLDGNLSVVGSLTNNGTINTNGNTFKVQVDSGDTYELQLDLDGNLSVVGAITAPSFIGALTGNASTATTLETTRSIALSGDATWSVNFNGSSNVTSALTLSTSGVTAGTYTKITVDAKGRATAGTALNSSDVTTALGFTPLVNNGKAVDSALLNGYTQTSAATANTIMWRDGSGNTSVNVLTGTATAARYADLAEIYSMDKEYSVGTVIALAQGGDTDCTQSWLAGQLCIGVISTNPAYLMNKDAEGQAVALKGRVPVRIIGPIKKGQSIMAGPDGCAIAGDINPIGCALSTNSDIAEKLVECVIL